MDASLFYYKKIGKVGYRRGPAIAFELGCALAVRADYIADYSYIERSTGLAIFELCESVYKDVRKVDDLVPDRCRGSLIDVRHTDEKLINLTTGLPLSEASLIKKRLYIMSLIVKRRDEKCISRLGDEVRKRGLGIISGPRFIHIYNGKGKLGVLEKLGKIFPSLRNSVIAYAGDTLTDKNALERADIAFVMPQPDYKLKVRPQRTDYIIPPYPAPRGWVWAVNKLMTYRSFLASETKASSELKNAGP